MCIAAVESSDKPVADTMTVLNPEEILELMVSPHSRSQLVYIKRTWGEADCEDYYPFKQHPGAKFERIGSFVHLDQNSEDTVKHCTPEAKMSNPAITDQIPMDSSLENCSDLVESAFMEAMSGPSKVKCP